LKIESFVFLILIQKSIYFERSLLLRRHSFVLNYLPYAPHREKSHVLKASYLILSRKKHVSENCTGKEVKESRNRPGVAQRVLGGLDSQISMTFGTWRWWACQPHAPAAFTPRKCSWYSFSL